MIENIVVKSFAASMAAAILTLADKSYAYPNALILHHQPSTWGGGNLFEMREKVKIFQDWAKRLHRPVAQKMGLSLEDFYKKMYENSVGGDWQEFADQAVKLNPNNFASQFCLAKIHFLTANYNAVDKCLNVVLSNHKYTDCFEAIRLLAKVKCLQNKKYEALALYKRMLELNP